MQYLTQLNLQTGRIFRRTNSCGIGLLGVVEVPQDLKTEVVHACILMAGALSLSWKAPRQPMDTYEEPIFREDLPELNADYFFYHGYRSSPQGGQEFFFRESVLPSSTPGMKWCYITGARREGSDQLPEDGMYELGRNFRRIQMHEDFGRGQNFGGLLREPVWGPGGAYGLGHTLEPSFFPKWVVAERERNAKRDPEFAEYMAAMAEHGEFPLFYTAAQRAERDALADRVMRKILDREDASFSPRGG